MLFGLGLGLVIALGIYLLAPGSQPAPPRQAAAPPEPAPAATPQPTEAAPPQPAPSEPAERAGTAEARTPGSRFDFYDMLPQFEVVIPEAEPGGRGGAATAASEAPRPVEEPGSYVLQVGSFSQLADADRRKASLALLGIESRIQRVAINGGTFHRVRIGPIDDLAEVNGIRRRLREARVESLLLRAPQ